MKINFIIIMFRLYINFIVLYITVCIKYKNLIKHFTTAILVL